jgi:hypothetical protein
MLDREFIKKFPQWQQDMIIEYAAIFDHMSPESRNPIKYGFQCGEGWKILIGIFLYRAREVKEDGKQLVQVVQIKEKFGGLRIYVTFEDNTPKNIVSTIWATASALECVSMTTCEECGKPGSTREGRWIRVRCEWCHMKTKIDYIKHWPLRIMYRIKSAFRRHND